MNGQGKERASVWTERSSAHRRALAFGALTLIMPLVALGYLAVDASHAPLVAVLAIPLTLIAGVGVSLTISKSVRTALENVARKQSAPRALPRHPVSGLKMREALLAAMARDLHASQAPAMLGIVRFANFDHLVAFNATAADAALAGMGKRLIGALKQGRIAAHVDRDCFAVWFAPGIEHKSASAELEALGYVLMQELKAGELAVVPDIQLGSALYPMDADEPGNLLNRAFVSLARPQRTADGAIAFFARPSRQEARRRFSLEQDLRRAVSRGELTLHYQPFVDLAMGRVVGAEALLRWRASAEDPPPASQVIKILEETGLVHEIGLWTVNAACRQLREWRETGLCDLKLAVNLSAYQLHDRALPAALVRTVAAHGLTPHQLELELTETVAMEDVQRTQSLFHELREAGFSLAIDDFGSGYSSLAYLRRLPFQKLKIDREFVARVDERADSRTICKALIDLTAGLELAVLAEGVERVEEVETLRMMGCSTFQGYYFAKPMPAAEFQSTVTNPEWLSLTQSRVRREREEIRRRLV